MSEEKKIIIDEDWKNQVETEKEELEHAKEEAPAEGDAAEQQMPPASLEMLISMLATEATVNLGQMPHPATGEAMVNLDQAQYLIDMVEVIQEKTKGNIPEEESKGMGDLLHQLRMIFIAVKTGKVPQPE